MKYKSILFLDELESCYTRGIKSELQNIADKVDSYFYRDLYISPFLYNKLHHKDCQKQREKSISDFFDYIKNRKYDIILVKTPLDMSVSFFERLRTIFNNVPIINYNWRSIKESDIFPYSPYFSKIYSFDRLDCEKYNLNYYPLFFLRDFENVRNNSKKIYNFAHIGSAYNLGRLEFMTKVMMKARSMNLQYFFYLYAPGKRRALDARIKYPYLASSLYSCELSLNEVINKFSATESMVDHPITIQSGLTMRTFETLGSGLFLYTSNEEITKEPFFNPDRIKVIDKDLNGFKYEMPDFSKSDDDWQASFTQYRIDNWVKHIMSV